MTNPTLKDLTLRLESSEPLGRREKAAIVDTLDGVSEGRAIWPETHAEQIGSTDVALHVVDELFPGWAIRLTGKASEAHGEWVCTLRKSAERDNDEIIGIGQSGVLAQAILAACLRLVALKHHL